MSTLPAVSLSEARSHLGDLVTRAQHDHEPVYIERHGRRVAAIIDADDLAHLMALAEDTEDIAEAEQARAEMVETAATPIPWEDVKRDLGLA